MPTVLRVDGFRFVICPSDHPPAHVTRRSRRGRSGQDDRAAGLRAASARYDAATDFVMTTLTNGLLLGFPASAVPGLAGATPAQRAALELSPSGAGIHWEALDADISVPGLLADAVGRLASMSALGRSGGEVSSKAKTAAARANGKKGGRPKKKPTKRR
ncbi:MAG: DUF2442 domain-containing protein [Gemmatimonadaceae bacterium]